MSQSSVEINFDIACLKIFFFRIPTQTMDTSKAQQVHDELINRLHCLGQCERTFATFERIAERSEQVLYVEQLLLEHKLMPGCIGFIPKDDNRSLSLRKFGNQQFANENYVDALRCYNESICYAVTAEHLSIAYANRSAVYFKIKEYGSCLANIELAKKFGYPKQYLHKINSRQTQCLRLLLLNQNNRLNQREKPKRVTFSSHSSIPTAASCLEIKRSPSKGRHIVTNTALTPGQVVSIEETAFHAVRPKHRRERCSNCLRNNNFDLIPCRWCTTVMFCGLPCMAEAHCRYHRFECQTLDLWDAHFEEHSIWPIQIAIKFFTSFTTIDELVEMVNQIDSGRMPNDLKCYQLYGIIGFDDTVIPLRIRFGWAVVAAIAYRQLIYGTPLMAYDMDAKRIFRKLLYRSVMTIPSHGQELFDRLYNVQKETETDDPFAVGVYAVSALMNHSCEYNTAIANAGTRQIIQIMCPIPSGGELFVPDKYMSYQYFSYFIRTFEFVWIKSSFFLTQNSSLGL